MKTSLIKLSSSIILFSLSFTLWAKPVAQVTDINGTVFVITDQGQTSVLKVNQHLEEKSEVMVEEGASVTFNDYYDSTYHLIGGSHLKFFDKSVQLKKGKTWIQSLNDHHPLALTTANGFVNYQKGEFVATFDQSSGRSQVLVVNGEVEVSNVLKRNLKYEVLAGSFTVIDPEVENGLPRAPTKVGLQSLHSALAEFKRLPQALGSSPQRSIASVEDKPGAKKGKIIFIKSSRTPASLDATIAAKRYKKSTKRLASPIAVKIYGSNWSSRPSSVPSQAAPRRPASVKTSGPRPLQSVPVSWKTNPAFTESLKKHQADQPKYTKEFESLMRDLNSF